MSRPAFSARQYNTLLLISVLLDLVFTDVSQLNLSTCSFSVATRGKYHPQVALRVPSQLCS
jgi:hypothetical protein